MISPALRVAVVGGGIAGLTHALALSRAGLDCQVYEQAEVLTEVGAGVQIAPNAARLLHRLGLESELSAVAVRPEAVEFRRWDDGAVLGRTPLGSLCAERYGAPYYAVHRADLQGILLRRLPPGVLSLGRRCAAIEESADEVTLTFEDGSHASADVLVGADGIHSVVRGALVHDVPAFSGQSTWRSLVAPERVPILYGEPKVIIWIGPDRHSVCYPVRSGKLVNLVATTPAGDWKTESWSAAGDPEELAAAYTGWDPRLREALGAARSWSRMALHDRDAVASWSGGRVTLAGDAAHPMLPFLAQGANQAIEDAAALAVCLRQADPGDPAPALRRYQDIREPRTAAVQRMSRGNKALDAANGDRGGMDDLTGKDWLYGYDAEQEAAEWEAAEWEAAEWEARARVRRVAPPRRG